MKVRLLFKKKASSDKNGLIYIALYLKDAVELISTGQRIDEKDWSKNDRYPKDHTGAVAVAIKEKVALLDDAIGNIKRRKQLVTPGQARTEFKAIEKSLIDDQLEEDRKEKKNRRSVNSLSTAWLKNNLFKYQESTKKAITESINQFLEFLDKTGQRAIAFENISPSLLTSYERYLQEKKKLANSTHGKRIKHLRWFLKSLGYNTDGIKIRTSKKEIISLTPDELECLENKE